MFLLLAAAVAGCGGGDDPPGSQACVDTLPRDCATLWPDYDAIHKNLFATRCATASACHNAQGAKGGLSLEDADAAYQALLGADGHIRVIPGDPECSPLMERLASDDPQFRMPPGPPLTAQEICAVTKWIDEGAER